MTDYFGDQTVLITGASGFIGSHLTKCLVQKGANVHILVQENSDLWRLQEIPENILTVWRCDLRNSRFLGECVRNINPQKVFHFGALVNAERNPVLLKDMIDINVLGTVNLAVALMDSRCECFINFGTCEEYGNSEAPFHEENRESPVSPYSASKVAATHFCQMLYRMMGFPVITVRPFLTYGTHQLSQMLIPDLIRRCLTGERQFALTTGIQTREFNYVQDIVECVLQLSRCQELSGEVVNIGNGKEYTILDVARTIVRLTGSSLELQPGKLPYRKGEVFHFYSATDKMEKYIQVQDSVSLETGLELTIQWFRSYLNH
tara:strand:+ start:878 stop:1834 length:957 start_codon:yes stop_codon:yes gene_type:complete